MKVLTWSDIIHVLELHLESSEVANIAPDLSTYAFELEDSKEGCKDCVYSWWNGEQYECMRPTCRFESKEVEKFLEGVNERANN